MKYKTESIDLTNLLKTESKELVDPVPSIVALQILAKNYNVNMDVIGTYSAVKQWFPSGKDLLFTPDYVPYMNEKHNKTISICAEIYNCKLKYKI